MENAQWTLRSNSNCLNKWIIGSADYNIGPSALYVWPGSGNSVGYTNSEGWITAFRTIVLPANELCDVTFDWKCLGDEGLDYAYVCWVTDTLQVIGSNSNTTIPNWVASTAKTVSSISANGKEMVKSSIWRSAKFTVMGTGKPAKLVFFWINDARTNFNPGAVIDNIMIKSTECSEPTDFNVITDDNNIILTWDSLINNCEVMYRNTEVNFDASFITIQNQSSPCTIPNLPKGRYSFWVRQVCDTSEYGYSSWVKDHNVLSIINDRCINFIDFTSPYVSATYGVYTNPYQNVGFVNFGQFSIDSRHTVNYTQDYDLRTNYGLKVIPDGSLVSVRLGNWDVYTKAETITYTYTVDSLASILLMKYAVVLQFPNHPAAKQPFFQLQILDGNDNLIDPNCGDFTFIPGTNTTDWNENNGVIWKDWTTIGLNLQAYRGRTIKIRLVTKDCADIGHYGYAYFTLDCAKAQLEGMTCGHIHADSICAPEGFIYHWYKNTDPYTIVSLDLCFLPQPGDTAEYTCRVVYPNNSGCSFNLSAVLDPR